MLCTFHVEFPCKYLLVFECHLCIKKKKVVVKSSEHILQDIKHLYIYGVPGTSDSALITAAEASTVALVMMRVIILSMFTRAFGSLPREEQQEKAGQTALWAAEP